MHRGHSQDMAHSCRHWTPNGLLAPGSSMHMYTSVSKPVHICDSPSALCGEQTHSTLISRGPGYLCTLPLHCDMR